MRVLMVTSEAVPFAKTGGLADVCGALPRALEALGHDVALVLPRYGTIDRAGLAASPVPLGVPTGVGERWCGVLATTLPRSGVRVWLVDHDALYDRPGLYGPPRGEGYGDNCLRFTVLCRAALQICRREAWVPDVVHCHDWQSALVPSLLDAFERDSPLARTATLLTIHNLAYQGRFPAGDFAVTGLGWERFTWQGFEFYGGFNVLKGGLAGATLLSTVSPTYAAEIRTPAQGELLDDLLRHRAGDLHGVLNGIDVEAWNPATDAALAARYSAATLDGKEECARDLRHRAGLAPAGAGGEPLLAGFVGRLTSQKGADVVAAAAERLVAAGVQLVVLGTGDAGEEAALAALGARLPGVRAWIGFDEELAHRIYAGCDLLLMPSRFEPCGLNQLYAMRYGTLPVVTPVGGLCDTVREVAGDEGTGFFLGAATGDALVDAVARAVALARGDRPAFDAAVRRAMARDSGWDRAARQYEELYDEARARHAGG
jgi:starch synthase